jgi:PHD finger-like domain-containing protein 5A
VGSRHALLLCFNKKVLVYLRNILGVGLLLVVMNSFLQYRKWQGFFNALSVLYFFFLLAGYRCGGNQGFVESNMAKHHPDLIMCRKQPGIAIGRLCEKDDGKCVICDSYVRPCTLVRICDECNYGSFQGRCVICGGVGISDAYYCKECTQLEKDRDGCPKIVNLGSAKTDLFYERKKYGFKKRW